MWYWYIITFICGVMFGIFFIALVIASKDNNKES